MRKIIIALLLLLSFVCCTQPTWAAGLGDAMGNLDRAVGGSSGLERDLSTTIGIVVKGALSMVGTIFLLLTIYAGILWMTAQGAEDKIEKAKNIVTAAIIGLFITMAAYAITYFVTGRLSDVGSESQGNFTPQVNCVGIKDEQTCYKFKCEWFPGSGTCGEEKQPQQPQQPGGLKLKSCTNDLKGKCFGGKCVDPEKTALDTDCWNADPALNKVCCY